MPRKPPNKIVDFERALAQEDAQRYVLRLCISGMTPRSREAITNLRQICDTYFPGHYQFEIIDIYQQPELAATHHILATPTLLKSSPLPVRRLIGDLSNRRETLRRLGIFSNESDS